MIKNCDIAAVGLPSVDEIVNKAEGLCPVQWAVDVVKTAHAASCGKDVMCRDGLAQLYLISSEIAQCKADMDDFELLQRLCDTIILAAGCDTAHQAATLMKASIQNHENDWRAHILRKRCVAIPLTPVTPAAAAGEGGMRRRRRVGG